MLVLSGLTCDKARPNGDGPGDHARAMSAFLTGSQPRKTHGADIKAGTSFDQFLAQRIGEAAIKAFVDSLADTLERFAVRAPALLPPLADAAGWPMKPGWPLKAV